MERGLIKQHTSAIIKGFITEANAVKNLDNKTQKGRLRELFTSKILAKFLTSQFSTGTGLIINLKGKQSEQIDIIIYDNRILPPFIEERTVGVYPAECVLGIIEVRSFISKKIIKDYVTRADKLYKDVYYPQYDYYHDFAKMRPFYALVGFSGNCFPNSTSQADIFKWLSDNTKPLMGVCRFDRFSWLNLKIGGSLKMVDKYNEETKAFVAVLLDNIRTVSQIRYDSLSHGNHRDYLGIYMRDQGSVFPDS